MKFLKKSKLLVCALFITTIAVAQNKPASPAAVTTGNINGATISINYSSPSVKGRVIWGELVPFGKIWRAGANAATTIESDKEITIEGKKLPAGQLRVVVKQKIVETSTENLVYTIEKNSIVLSWEKWNIPFSVK